jgi:hypothetical protein
MATPRAEICGAEGTRTPDPLHAMEVRYQLRYSPANAKRQHSAEEHAPVTGTEADRGRINTYPPDSGGKCTHSPESGGNGVNFPECGKKC